MGIAAYKGNLNVVDMLHTAGADINLIKSSGISPLYLAIKANKPECAKYLIDRKALIHYSDSYH